ncbi:stage II sporulation protein R [Tepidibacillus marianensis]|uniref:stage II sporulation protein R n=1 Tax=Tepidibacillus marianensis TaxID=3131995 RepID=UPI0030CE1A2D
MKRVLYFIFIFSVLLMSWDGQKQDAAIAAPSNQQDVIPNEAIRLRIIANSDSPEDQMLKLKIRDQVVTKIDPWVGSLANIGQAREVIRGHLPELQQVVDQTIAKNGYEYKAKVELGVVPFPTKMYGQIVYPAGDYEALRITVGEGQGQNWWCVLFPPLCFVDMSNGDAVKADSNATVEAESTAVTPEKTNEDVEVKFLIVELFSKLFAFISSLFN